MGIKSLLNVIYEAGDLVARGMVNPAQSCQMGGDLSHQNVSSDASKYLVLLETGVICSIHMLTPLDLPPGLNCQLFLYIHAMIYRSWLPVIGLL